MNSKENSEAIKSIRGNKTKLNKEIFEAARELIFKFNIHNGIHVKKITLDVSYQTLPNKTEFFEIEVDTVLEDI